MRFTFDGSDYAIEFSRYYREILRYVGGKRKTVQTRYPYTTVNLVRFLPEGGVVVHRTYTVGCHHTDAFSLEEGRKSALRMMTKGNSLGTAFKQAIWSAYLTRPRG
jgi:hypothetical protein